MEENRRKAEGILGNAQEGQRLKEVWGSSKGQNAEEAIYNLVGTGLVIEISSTMQNYY